MQEPNTGNNGNTTSDTRQRGLAAFGDELPKHVGPFHRGDIEQVTARCAKRLGIDWDEIPIEEKKQKLGIAVDVLTGALPVRKLEQSHSNIPSEERTLGLMLLEEFRNSPKWDTDEFNRGYKASNMDTAVTDVGGAETQSSR